MLPSVTGMRFWKMNWLKVSSAPSAMPRGIRNLQPAAAAARRHSQQQYKEYRVCRSTTCMLLACSVGGVSCKAMSPQDPHKCCAKITTMLSTSRLGTLLSLCSGQQSM